MRASDFSLRAGAYLKPCLQLKLVVKGDTEAVLGILTGLLLLRVRRCSGRPHRWRRSQTAEEEQLLRQRPARSEQLPDGRNSCSWPHERRLSKKRSHQPPREDRYTSRGCRSFKLQLE